MVDVWTEGVGAFTVLMEDTNAAAAIAHVWAFVSSLVVELYRTVGLS